MFHLLHAYFNSCTVALSLSLPWETVLWFADITLAPLERAIWELLNRIGLIVL